MKNEGEHTKDSIEAQFKRLETWRWFLLLWQTLTDFPFIILTFLFLMNVLMITISPLLGIFSTFGIFYFMGTLKNKWRKNFQRIYMPHFIETVKVENYIDGAVINNDLLSKSLIYRGNAAPEGGELFTWHQHDIEISIYEQVQDKGNDGEKHLEATFVLIELPQKKFEGTTVLSNDPDYYNKQAASDLDTIQPVETSTLDNKDGGFHLLSDTPVEAHYIGHDVALDNFLKIHTAFGKPQMTVSFWDKYMLMIIPGDPVNRWTKMLWWNLHRAAQPPGHFYVPDLKRTVADKDTEEMCKKQVKAITAYADWLELHKLSEDAAIRIMQEDKTPA